MSYYPPPTENVAIFDEVNFRSGEIALTQAAADLRYLRYPNAQGTENLQAINVNGLATFNSTITAPADLVIDPVGSVNLNSSNLNMNGGQIINCPLVLSTVDNNISVEARGTGDVILKTNGVNRLTISDTGLQTFQGGATYNNVTNTFTATTFDGSATSVTIVSDNTSGSYYIPFTKGTAGTGKILYVDDTTGPFTYNPSTGALNAATTLKIAGTGGNGNIAMGVSSGTSQISSSVAIGTSAGANQNTSCIAIGSTVGASQSNNSIAIGNNCSTTFSASSAIAIGTSVAVTNQAVNAVAIGSSCGTSQGQNCVAIGYQTALISQGNGAVAIGTAAGQSSAAQTISIGENAGKTAQAIQGIAIGTDAGNDTQGTLSVAIGTSAGQYVQGTNAVAIGNLAGQGQSGVAASYQGSYAVAIGDGSGFYGQGANAVAAGRDSGKTSQGTGAVAIGYGAGQNIQGNNAIAIGTGAGQGLSSGQGENSIAIGYLACKNSQVAGSICLNASGAALDTTQIGFFVNPIRGVAHGIGVGRLKYDTTTFEITYSTT